jgi:hypothetical protein
MGLWKSLQVSVENLLKVPPFPTSIIQAVLQVQNQIESACRWHIFVTIVVTEAFRPFELS